MSESADVGMGKQRHGRHASAFEFLVMLPRREQPVGEPIILQNVADDFVVRQNQSEEVLSRYVREKVAWDAGARTLDEAVGGWMINDSPFAFFDKFQRQTELALECLSIHRGFRRPPFDTHKRRSHYRGDSLPLGSRSLQPDHLRKVKQIAKLFKAKTIG